MIGEKKSSNEKMKMKYNFRNTGSLSNLTRPNTEHEKMKLEQKAFQVFNDKGHLTRQLGMLSTIRPIYLLPVTILINGSDRTGSSDRTGIAYMVIRKCYVIES